MENLLILLGVIGLFFLMMRRDGSGMGCCGGGHSHGNPPEKTEDESENNPQANLVEDGTSDRKAGGCH